MHKCVNYKLKLLIIGTGQYETHQGNVVYGYFTELPMNPHGSYQMPLPICCHHHQQNNHLQQSAVSQHQVHHNHEKMIQLQHPTITQGQHYNHQQNVHLHQLLMHQPPMFVKCHTTPKLYNPCVGSATYNAKPQYAVPQTDSHCVKRQQPQALVKDLSSLPNCKIPVGSPILWKLSQEVMEWKFLGRYLDLEEEIIEEIDYNTRPNKTRDKALKVLTEWVNSSAPTWKTLGKVLNAKNILLYDKLLKLLDKYGVGIASPTTDV